MKLHQRYSHVQEKQKEIGVENKKKRYDKDGDAAKKKTGEKAEVHGEEKEKAFRCQLLRLYQSSSQSVSSRTFSFYFPLLVRNSISYITIGALYSRFFLHYLANR